MAEPVLPRVVGWARLIVPVVAFATPLVALFSQTTLKFDTPANAVNSVATIAAVSILGVLIGFGVRQFVLPATAGADQGGAAPRPGGGGQLRDRLALNVVAIGTLGIAGTAMVLLITIAVQAKEELKTTGFSIFTATLPVFATWVGTVLAFYFTNESFRQAAESAQGLSRGVESEPITRAGTMVPFDRIIRREMTTAEVGGIEPRLAAEKLPLRDIEKLFAPPGVVRVVIFDDSRKALLVIKHEFMPTTVAPGDTLKTYLDLGVNRTASRNFALAAETATVGDGRRMLELRKVTDLFVTQHGLEHEPVMGWVPDDNLKKSV